MSDIDNMKRDSLSPTRVKLTEEYSIPNGIM